MSLIGKDLWDILDGTETLPDGANDQQREFNKPRKSPLGLDMFVCDAQDASLCEVSRNGERSLE